MTNVSRQWFDDRLITWFEDQSITCWVTDDATSAWGCFAACFYFIYSIGFRVWQHRLDMHCIALPPWKAAVLICGMATMQQPAAVAVLGGYTVPVAHTATVLDCIHCRDTVTQCQ